MFTKYPSAISKFAHTWNLNVSERRSLVNSTLDGLSLAAEILKILDQVGHYPIDLNTLFSDRENSSGLC